MINDVSKSIKHNIKQQKSLYISVFWGALAGVFGQGLNFVTNIFLARFLGEKYGELVLYISTNGMLQTFSLFGLNIIATVLIADNLRDSKLKLEKTIPNLYYIVIFLTICISLFALLINKSNLFTFSLWNIKSDLALFVVILWFITSSIDILQISILSGFGAFKDIAKVTVIKGIFSIIIVLFSVHFWGITGAVFGYAVSFCISLFFNYFFIYQNCKQEQIKIKMTIDFKLIVSTLKSCTPIFMSSLILVPSQWAVNYIVFHKPNGSLALTIFGVANQWMVLIQFFPMQISKVILPFLTKHKDNKANYKKIEKTGLLINIAISSFLILFATIFHKQILSLYKVEHPIANTVFIILVFGSIFSIINLYLGYAAIARGKSWLRAIADGVMSLTLFASFVIIIKFSVFMSLPLSYCISFIFGSFLIYILSKSNRSTPR